MWSLGLLAYSWLFLQTIGSAHFSRGMSSDRPGEHMTQNYHHSSEIRISVNFTKLVHDSGRQRGADSIRQASSWVQSDSSVNSNRLILPRINEIVYTEKISVTGMLVMVESAPPSGGKSLLDDKDHSACTKIRNPKTARPWIALVKDGGCDHKQKMTNIFQHGNVTGIIIYGEDGDSSPKNGMSSRASLGSGAGTTFGGGVGKSGKRGGSQRSRKVVVWVKNSILTEIRARCNKTFPCNATLMVDIRTSDGLINRTSVLFVSISFILLMIISLAWLVFYYVQRFRYIHAKERLSRRLANAAKKALTKIPVKTLLRGDPETENEYDQCAVCIEQYKPSDTIRILPCRHYFHKSCIDPWLLEQRSCPMCKLDILKAYGLQVRGFSEGPSDTLGEHSDVNAMSGRATSVSLEGTGREASPMGDEATERAADEAEGGGVTTRLVSSEESRSTSSATGGPGNGGASPAASTGGGIRVTIEPPEVQYHHPGSGGAAEAAGGATVEVVVEQHLPRSGRSPNAEDDDDEEEDEEAAALLPLSPGEAKEEAEADEC